MSEVTALPRFITETVNARDSTVTYLITAVVRGQFVGKRRTQKASAAVVAMKLQAEGGTDVTIRDETGQNFDIEAFRRRYIPLSYATSLGPSS
jgi:uncharacterized Ntn-hydrolase superfamily protein